VSAQRTGVLRRPSSAVRSNTMLGGSVPTRQRASAGPWSRLDASSGGRRLRQDPAPGLERDLERGRGREQACTSTAGESRVEPGGSASWPPRRKRRQDPVPVGASSRVLADAPPVGAAVQATSVTRRRATAVAGTRCCAAITGDRHEGGPGLGVGGSSRRDVTADALIQIPPILVLAQRPERHSRA
jgi:hypothetical protein